MERMKSVASIGEYLFEGDICKRFIKSRQTLNITTKLFFKQYDFICRIKEYKYSLNLSRRQNQAGILINMNRLI